MSKDKRTHVSNNTTLCKPPPLINIKIYCTLCPYLGQPSDEDTNKQVEKYQIQLWRNASTKPHIHLIYFVSYELLLIQAKVKSHHLLINAEDLVILASQCSSPIV